MARTSRYIVLSARPHGTVETVPYKPAGSPQCSHLLSRFVFSLFPTLLQSALRAVVRGFSLMFESSRSPCSVPHRRPFAFLRCSRYFRHAIATDVPCVRPVCKRHGSVSTLCAALSLLLDKQPAQRLSGAFACIPRSPLTCRCFVLGWLLTVAAPHITIYRTFNHTRTICSILIMASKTPLHQSAGAFSLLSGLEQVLQQRIF